MKAIDLKRYSRLRLMEIENAIAKLSDEMDNAPTLTLELQIKAKALELTSCAQEIYKIMDTFGIQYNYIKEFRHGKFITK